MAPACYGSSLGSNPFLSQKYKMGDISKEVTNTLQPAKKYRKKYMCRSKLCWYLRLFIGLGNLLLYEVKPILFYTFFIHKTLRTLDFRKLLQCLLHWSLYSRSNYSYYAPFPPQFPGTFPTIQTSFQTYHKHQKSFHLLPAHTRVTTAPTFHIFPYL